MLALGMMPAAKKHVFTLRHLLDDTAPSVRAASAFALGELASENADIAEAVVRKLSDNHPGVRLFLCSLSQLLEIQINRICAENQDWGLVACLVFQVHWWLDWASFSRPHLILPGVSCRVSGVVWVSHPLALLVEVFRVRRLRLALRTPHLIAEVALRHRRQGWLR